MNPRYLITGTSSGLGRYLTEELYSTPFNRADTSSEIEDHSSNYYDAIIHCAADTRNSIKSCDLWSYYQSNIALAEKLTRIPHGLFVFISSPAVYPDPFGSNTESDVVNLPEIPCHHTYPIYGLFKMLAEQTALRNTRKSLILRPTCIVGRTTKPSANISKVLRGDSSPLSLSGDSSFNLVSMSQIKKFIELALLKNITGVFNLGATSNATLTQIAQAVSTRPTFGGYIHNVHKVNTDKVRQISDEFNKDSIELAMEVATELRGTPD